MKKKYQKILIIIWLIILTLKVFEIDKNIDWIQAQQDNVIEVLLEN